MLMCSSIVTLLYSVGSVQSYVVFSYCSGIGGCCHVLVDSRGGIFSSFSDIHFHFMELQYLLLFLFKTHCMLPYCLRLDSQCTILYLTDHYDEG